MTFWIVCWLALWFIQPAHTGLIFTFNNFHFSTLVPKSSDYNCSFKIHSFTIHWLTLPSFKIHSFKIHSFSIHGFTAWIQQEDERFYRNRALHVTICSYQWMMRSKFLLVTRWINNLLAHVAHRLRDTEPTRHVNPDMVSGYNCGCLHAWRHVASHLC